MKALFESKEGASGKDDEEHTSAEAIYGLGRQVAEGALEGTDASIKAVEDDEAFGRIAATEGFVARNRNWASTIISSWAAWRRQVKLSQQRVYP
jgi:hypothetical protein